MLKTSISKQLKYGGYFWAALDDDGPGAEIGLKHFKRMMQDSVDAKPISDNTG